MRAQKFKHRKQETKHSKVDLRCIICKKNKCIDDVVVEAKDQLQPSQDFDQRRITRSVSKILHYLSEFIIVEIYRCMPLLGDEEKVPNWDVHICRYAIVFTNKN